MEATLNLIAGSTGASTSDVVRLSGYANPSGAGTGSILIVRWEDAYIDGTLASVILQHSSDESAWTTLWDCGTLTGDNAKVFYTFNHALRLSYSYTVGDSTTDAGARATFTLRTFGPRNWAMMSITKAATVRALDPRVCDTAKNFQLIYPEKQRLAKRDIEMILRGRGIDYLRLHTDGADTEPCNPALELPGAWRTLYHIWASADVMRDDVWSSRLDAIDNQFNYSIEAALTSGKLEEDRDLDMKPSDADIVRRSVRLYR